MSCLLTHSFCTTSKPTPTLYKAQNVFKIAQKGVQARGFVGSVGEPKSTEIGGQVEAFVGKDVDGVVQMGQLWWDSGGQYTLLVCSARLEWCYVDLKTGTLGFAVSSGASPWLQGRWKSISLRDRVSSEAIWTKQCNSTAL